MQVRLEHDTIQRSIDGPVLAGNECLANDGTTRILIFPNPILCNINGICISIYNNFFRKIITPIIKLYLLLVENALLYKHLIPSTNTKGENNIFAINPQPETNAAGSSDDSATRTGND